MVFSSRATRRTKKKSLEEIGKESLSRQLDIIIVISASLLSVQHRVRKGKSGAASKSTRATFRAHLDELGLYARSKRERERKSQLVSLDDLPFHLVGREKRDSSRAVRCRPTKGIELTALSANSLARYTRDCVTNKLINSATRWKVADRTPPC